jgi:hypothetical protein
MDWAKEEQETYVQVIQSDYQEWLHTLKQHDFWKSVGVIGRDIIQAKVDHTKNLMFLQLPDDELPRNWVMVEDSGKGEEKYLVPSKTLTCISKDSPPTKTQGRKWKLDAWMSQFSQPLWD